MIDDDLDLVAEQKPFFDCAICDRRAYLRPRQTTKKQVVCYYCGVVRQINEVVLAIEDVGREDILAEAHKRRDQISSEAGPEPGSQDFRDRFESTPVFVYHDGG